MASKKEKKLGIILGSIIGLIIGVNYFKKNNSPKEHELLYLLGSILFGGFSGYFSSLLIGSPNDTVNYSLFKRKKLVYHGITYKDRLTTRCLEHRKRGLRFDNIIADKPKARIDALLLEKKKIKKHRPIYNIQHNKYSKQK